MAISFGYMDKKGRSFNQFWNSVVNTLKIETPQLLRAAIQYREEPHLMDAYYRILQDIFRPGRILFYYTDKSKLYGCHSGDVNSFVKLGLVALRSYSLNSDENLVPDVDLAWNQNLTEDLHKACFYAGRELTPEELFQVL